MFTQACTLSDESPTHFSENHSFCFSLSDFLTYFSVSLPLFLFSSLLLNQLQIQEAHLHLENRNLLRTTKWIQICKEHTCSAASSHPVSVFMRAHSKNILFLLHDSNSFCHKEFVTSSLRSTTCKASG